MRRTQSRQTHPRSRGGFTLVELLVAVVILNVGLLALVSASAALVRRHAGIRARSNAARIAASRLAQLAAAPCSASGGAATHINEVGAPTETWSVASAERGVLEVTDSVVYVAGGPRASIALHTRVVC